AGNTINKSPGPSVGSNPNAKTTGKIASPASRDTKIFIVTTLPAEVVKLTSFSKYELYVTIHENPTAREKKDCPNAYNTALPVILVKSDINIKIIPSNNPSSIIESNNNIII